MFPEGLKASLPVLQRTMTDLRFFRSSALVVGHTGLEQSDQFISVFRNFFDLVSFIFHFPEKPDDTGWGIQPDTVSDSAVTIRVVGKDDGHPFFSIRRFSQADPIGCKLSNMADLYRVRNHRLCLVFELSLIHISEPTRPC